MKLFLDTNILLDIFLARVPHLSAAQALWTFVEQGRYKAGISAISINNCYYIVRKLGNSKKADLAIATLLTVFDIVPVDKNIFEEAKIIQLSDFEDAVQYVCASRYRAERIISRNLSGFRETEIPILSADAFLASLAD